jgi:diaminopimelate decarboxylase
MTGKKLPFTKEKIKGIISRYPTPFHIYDEAAIRANARKLLEAFSWAPGFTNYFAVKATPNPHIMKILHEEGFGFDCSSLPELLLAEKIGAKAGKIMFSSNDTPAQEYVKAIQLGALINLDDVNHIDFMEKHSGLPEILGFRYNPGALRDGNEIIGKPEESKFGVTRQQILDGITKAKLKGVKRFGLHTMVISNELNPQYLIETGRMLFLLTLEIYEKTGIVPDYINLGGGYGIPYHPQQEPIDIEYVSSGIKKAYTELLLSGGISGIKLFLECGRYITGPYGYLVSKVLHKKKTYKTYIGLDACAAHLIRPAIYKAYHHITVLGKEAEPADCLYDVTGSLCENNDKFAIDRKLPHIEPGDILVIHDTGAHGYAMGFNYNGKLRSAEILLRKNGSVDLIRRAETQDDYFATLDFSRI